MDRKFKSSFLLIYRKILFKILTCYSFFHNPWIQKNAYPFDLLLAPLPQKYKQLSYTHFPEINRKSGKRSLFLYPAGWLKWFIYLFGILPSLFLSCVSLWTGGAYLVLYFWFYRFLYLGLRVPVLDAVLRQWPPFLNRFIQEVPQQLYDKRLKEIAKKILPKKYHEYLPRFLVFLTGPGPLYKRRYRNPVNWSSNSQQECFLVLSIFDLFKGDKQNLSIMEKPNVKFLMFAYFPVGCSYMLLLCFLLVLYFTPLSNKLELNTASTLKFFVLSGITWAALSLLFSLKMKWFLEKFSKDHNQNDLKERMKRWLPINIKEEKYLEKILDFDPSVVLLATKMTALVQVAIITIFFLLIRMAKALNPEQVYQQHLAIPILVHFADKAHGIIDIVTRFFS